jgi:glycosyltransferase involved in cell wall biosynthesis
MPPGPSSVRIAMLLHKSVEFDSRVRREAGALARAGHSVTVLELAKVPRGEPLDGFTRDSAMPPEWMRRYLPFHLYRVAFLIGFIAGLLRVKPDVVHAHDAAMLLPGVIGARLTGAQLIYDSHELATSVPYRERAWAWFVAAIERIVVPRCTGVITVADGIALRLRERYRLASTPTVVRNVSELEPTGKGDLRARIGIDQHTPLVLHQGAPAPARGCEVLVAAIERLPGVHLAFLGDPEPGYASMLREVVRERGVQDRVTLLPSVPLERLLAHTAEADVGVTLLQDTCENHRLALPNKLFEYIAAGVPVVASALPETRRLVESYAIGWCVPPADSYALARALRTALRERDDASLRKRMEEAQRELCWSREQKRLLELYARVATRSEAGEHEPVRTQRRNASKTAVQSSSAATRKRRGKRDRTDLEVPAKRGAQLGEADQPSVSVGSGYPWLPDRDRAAVVNHAMRLAEGRPHMISRVKGR